MIRVLQMIGSLNIGGSQAMILNLYEAIDRTKVQFDFILDEPTQRELADRVIQLGGKIYEMPKFTGKNFFEVKRAWKSFFAEHPEYKILHSHVRSYASIYFPIAKKYGVTTIIHSHSTSNGSGIKSLAKAMLQRPIRYMADYLFACSSASGQWLYGNSVTSKSNFKVIPNCIDISRFSFSNEKRAIGRQQLQIDLDDFVIGHVGRFHPVKNHRFLVDVFAEICKEKHNAKLLLIGDGELFGDIRSYCENLGLTDKVIFAGSQRDTSLYYSVMDVFVFPSLWEGVPVSVVEAQTSGLPCLISDVITNDVVLIDSVKKKALTENEIEWAKKIKSMTRSDNRHLDEKQLCLLHAFDSYSVADSLTSFYEKVFGGEIHE